MRVVRDLPRPTRQIDNAWIPLSDGTRLAARIWLPEDASSNPVPAILEYLPYRKSDGTLVRDSVRHPYLAGHGYAAVRVDMRGSGDSEGLLLDEYLPQEQEDALEVITWLAAQPWCTGAVGMWGISWGGFNALQVAARRPPALRAIMTLCSTDDRYADDVHYIGGCVSGLDMLAWATSMLAWGSLPPLPSAVGSGWRELWRRRLEGSPPFIEAWLRHQRRDDFWKQGSVCEDYSAITCAVYAVGGWADGYTNAVPRLLEGLSCPRKGLIGPWSHSFPEEGVPGPAIGFLQECVRWWDHWLKGIDTGVMDEPMLRAWIQDAVRPAPHYGERPGRWVAEAAWPPARSGPLRMWLAAPGALGARPAGEVGMQWSGAQSAGADAGAWCGEGQSADFPPDQRGEDGLSLCFTSVPLERPLEVLGFPEAQISLSSDRPQALLVARLCEVWPDGDSTLVSRGVLNLTHRASHEYPEPMVPGERMQVSVRLKVCGHRFSAGNRLRLSLSPTYWPWAWPSPQPVTLNVFAGPDSWLDLPARPPRPADASLAEFGEPECSPALEVVEMEPAKGGRALRRDLGSGLVEQVFDWEVGGVRRVPAADLELADSNLTTFTIVEGDPLSARVLCKCGSMLGEAGMRVRTEARATMSCDLHDFRVESELRVFDGDSEFLHRSWQSIIPRDMG